MTIKLSVINVGQNHKLFSIFNLCAQDLTETLGLPEIQIFLRSQGKRCPQFISSFKLKGVVQFETMLFRKSLAAGRPMVSVKSCTQGLNVDIFDPHL